MTIEQGVLLGLLVWCGSFITGLKLALRRGDRQQAERDRYTRFVHWASSHERQPSKGVEVCGCLHCEQMRRDLGLPETWRWKKWTIPARYK